LEIQGGVPHHRLLGTQEETDHQVRVSARSGYSKPDLDAFAPAPLQADRKMTLILLKY